MSKKIGVVFALAGVCALSSFLLSCGSSSSRPAGVLYVLTQGSLGYGNNVSSFAMDLNSGALSLVNSNASTCPTAASATDPEPCGLPLDILLDPKGATAFVLNQGTPCLMQGNQCVPNTPTTIVPSIYPYTVNSDGSLSAPGTAVNWTANSYPDTAVAMGRDAAGQFVFVIDSGSYPPPGYPTPSQSNPSCPHAPTGPTDVCPSISVFAAQPGSTSLALAGGSPFYLSKIPSALSAITFTPPGSSTSQELLFVTNNFDICTAGCVLPQHSDNTLSLYSVSSSGGLTEQPNSPYVISATNPISVQAVNTTPAGQATGGVFVYVGQGGGSGALYPFQLCTVQIPGVCSPQQVAQDLLIPVTSCSISCVVTVGDQPVGMVVDPTNTFLYGVSNGSSQVWGFKIGTSSGTLTALSPPNQPSQGSQPVSIALHPTVNNTGQFLYVSNNISNNIGGFTLSTTTGSMTSPTTTIAPAAPSGIAVH